MNKTQSTGDNKALGKLLGTRFTTPMFFHATKGLLLSALVLCSCPLDGIAQPGVAGSNSAPVVTLAIMPFQNLSGDTNAADWQTAFPWLMSTQLREVKSIRILPKSTVAFGPSELGLKAGEPLGPDSAKRLGQVMEARYVVWGSYERKGKQWQINIQAIHTASGRVSTNWATVSTNWSSMSLWASEHIMEFLKVKPAPEEQARLRRLNSKPPEALEILALAGAELAAGKSLDPIEQEVRRAISVDPDSAETWDFLASIQGRREKMEEASSAIRRALEIDPKAAHCHQVLGHIYASEGSLVSAEQELSLASRLDPFDESSLAMLGRINEVRGEVTQAILLLKRARDLAPYDSVIRASLGAAYALDRKEEDALSEIRAAERYSFATPGTDAELAIAMGYDALGLFPQAVQYYEKRLDFVQKQGLSSSQASRDLRAHTAALKERLSPHFITSSTPHAYSDTELESALKGKLSAPELLLVTNPLTCTPEMKRWAEQLIGKTNGELQKAELLCSEMTRRHLWFDTGESGLRTAEETFKAWSDPKATLCCQEYALLYVSLARAIGLKACFADVTRDFQDKPVSHACACVFLSNGQAALIDPAYAWFGVPHKEYKPLDDLHVIGEYLGQVNDLPKNLVAVKLVPESVQAHFNLAVSLVWAKRIEEAREEVARTVKLDPKSCLTLLGQGIIGQVDGHLDDAVTHFRQSLAVDPSQPEARYYLGQTLYQQGKLREALDELRLSLQGDLPPAIADNVRSTVTRINELLAGGQ